MYALNKILAKIWDNLKAAAHSTEYATKHLETSIIKNQNAIVRAT